MLSTTMRPAEASSRRASSSAAPAGTGQSAPNRVRRKYASIFEGSSDSSTYRSPWPSALSHRQASTAAWVRYRSGQELPRLMSSRAAAGKSTTRSRYRE